jgi:hypothetical protein
MPARERVSSRFMISLEDLIFCDDYNIAQKKEGRNPLLVYEFNE